MYWTCCQCCLLCMWDVCSNIVITTECTGHVVSVVCYVCGTYVLILVIGLTCTGHVVSVVVLCMWDVCSNTVIGLSVLDMLSVSNHYIMNIRSTYITNNTDHMSSTLSRITILQHTSHIHNKQH